VGDAVMRALDRNRREVFVPFWFRPAPVLQALAPGLVVRGYSLLRALRTRRAA
jgi:hypothetical protein